MALSLEYAWNINGPSVEANDFRLFMNNYSFFSINNSVLTIPSKFHEKGSLYRYVLMIRVGSVVLNYTGNVSVSSEDAVSISINPENAIHVK